MHYVYIIYSPTFKKYYVGETVNPIERTEQHKRGFYKSASTTFTNDWVLKLSLKITSRAEALVIEKYIKSMKSKAFLQNLIENPAYLSRFKEIAMEKLNIKIE
jgi:putative endonuclease